MIKRLFWFALGVVAGIAGLRYVKDKARRTAEGFSLETLIDDVVDAGVAAAKQAVEIVQNLIARDDSRRDSHDADVFVSGAASDDGSTDL
jgi:hypothetical protein